MSSCPDPGVALEGTEHKTTYSGDGLGIDTGDGILGALDLQGRTPRATSVRSAGRCAFTRTSGECGSE